LSGAARRAIAKLGRLARRLRTESKRLDRAAYPFHVPRTGPFTRR